jgi:hypothetical protein
LKRYYLDGILLAIGPAFIDRGQNSTGCRLQAGAWCEGEGGNLILVKADLRQPVYFADQYRVTGGEQQ